MLALRFPLMATAVPAALLSTLLSLSGAMSAPSGTVRRFDAIRAGRIALVPDPSGAGATLRVRTSIKAVCAVAYGRTTAFGRLATDGAMNPTGHQNHRAVLTGLKPATTYRYRLQGVGADGHLYQSRIYTFRTPAAAGSLVGRDVTHGARVLAVSSAFSPGYAGKNAVDGNPATEWSSRGDGSRAFITIDLRRRYRIRGVAFRTRSMSDGTAITRLFRVTVDGRRTYGPFPAGPRIERVNFTGRVIRFSVVRSTGGNTGATEVEVFAASAGGR